MIEIGRTLGIRRNEVGPASVLFFYLFLIIGAYVMGQAVGIALFLVVFPKHLPYVRIGSALAMGALVWVTIRLWNRLRLGLVVVGTLLFSAAPLPLFGCLRRFHV